MRPCSFLFAALTLLALSLTSCQNRDIHDLPAHVEAPTAAHPSASPQEIYRQGFRDGKRDAREGNRYAIRGGNQRNVPYMNGYADGFTGRIQLRN